MAGADEPSPWVVRFEPLFRRKSQVLDLAAGSGRHARYLEQRGHLVTAVERDRAALELCGASTLIEADLEDGSSVLAGARFDAVVVTNYLYRPIFAAIAAWVADDGVLICETFAEGQEQFGRPRNRDFLLAPGELLHAFSQMQVVAYEHGIEERPVPRSVERICAVRRSSPQRLSGFTAGEPGPSLSPSQIR